MNLITMGNGYFGLQCRVLADPSRRMMMMVRECTSTCFVLLVAVVPVWDPKDRFVERVTMTTAQSAGLIWVGLVE